VRSKHTVDESFDEMWEVIGAKIVKSNLVFCTRVNPKKEYLKCLN